MILPWICFILSVAAFLLTYVFWMRDRYFRLDHARRVLEQQVEELSKKLALSNDLKQKITIMVAHDLQSPLHFLNILSDHVSRFAANNQLSEVKAGTEEIKKATGNIHAFVKEISLWARSQHESFQLAEYPFSLSELVRELEQFFGDMLLMHRNELMADVPDDVIVYSNRDILKAILRNLIDNSNKHTRGGVVSLVYRVGENGPLLVVSDNGEGMSPTILQKIRQRLADPAANATGESDSRLGYQLVADFAHMVGYKMDVSSVQGTGTSVSIGGLLCQEPFAAGVHSGDIVSVCEPG